MTSSQSHMQWSEVRQGYTCLLMAESDLIVVINCDSAARMNKNKQTKTKQTQPFFTTIEIQNSLLGPNLCSASEI